ncbi:MAG: ComF family protein [Clostridia bacterium]|nr:ComF family protein [Clostridia bacterium]
MPLKDFEKHLFNETWKCNLCNREIFTGEYFCKDCERSLVKIDQNYCAHCGRKTLVPTEYCDTCKGFITAIDLGRSVYEYDDNSGKLVKGFKYYGKKYLAEIFAKDLANLYYKNYLNADCITYVPMTALGVFMRGYNQTYVLATELSKLINLPVEKLLEKKKLSKRQAKKGRAERLKLTENAFKLKKGAKVKGLSVLLVDDVTTTGATAQAIASLLKKKGARKIYLLTVASVAKKR